MFQKRSYYSYSSPCVLLSRQLHERMICGLLVLDELSNKNYFINQSSVLHQSFNCLIKILQSLPVLQKYIPQQSFNSPLTVLQQSFKSPSIVPNSPSAFPQQSLISPSTVSQQSHISPSTVL